MGTGGPCMEAALARRLVALRPLPLSALVGGGPGEGPQLLQVVAMSDSLDYVAACIQSGAHKHLQHARAEVWVGVLGGNRALVMMGVLCLHTCVHINQTHTHTYSLSLSLSRTHTRAHTHTLTLQQTLQQTHTHTPSQLIRLAAMRGTGPQSPTNPGADLQSISDSLEHLRHRYAMLSGYLLRAVRLEVQLFALHFLHNTPIPNTHPTYTNTPTHPPIQHTYNHAIREMKGELSKRDPHKLWEGFYVHLGLCLEIP